MDFLSNIVPFVASIANFLINNQIGLLFLGVGLFGAIYSFFRKLC